jgi:hypothetical protein
MTQSTSPQHRKPPRSPQQRKPPRAASRRSVEVRLDKRERARLAELEATVKDGLDAFVRVGLALKEIRDAQLYRATHKTFEDYCRERWGMERAHAYRQIEAARVADVLSPIGDIPANEAQARELVPLLDNKKKLKSTWRKLKKQHGEQLTADKIKQAVSAQQDEEEDRYADWFARPSDGTIRPLEIVHVELDEACVFVQRFHRHHKPPQGHRFSIGVQDKETGKLVGVVIVGRPVARNTDQRNTLEVTRLCTNGTPHACSKLYGAAARAGKELGYRKIQTFLLESETGASLKGSGWRIGGESPGGSWSVSSRPREDKHPLEPKIRWELDLR